MLNLLIDSSTERGVVAILDQDRLLAHIELPFGYHNSKNLLPAVQQALHDTAINLSELAFIAVGVGPGSYTGIRVAAAIAKTLSFAAHLPLVGVSSLQGFIPPHAGKFAAMIDAKISGVYLIEGVLEEGRVVYRSQPKVCALDQVSVALQEIRYVVTPNKKRLQTLWTQPSWEWVEQGISPIHMSRLASKKFETGDFSNDSSVELLYLRKTQAEIERERT